MPANNRPFETQKTAQSAAKEAWKPAVHKWMPISYKQTMDILTLEVGKI